MEKQYISISCLPLPAFVQGGYSVYESGDIHPNRTEFPYFIMIFLVKGALYIAEEHHRYTVLPGQMIIIQPNVHHYSWQPMNQHTEYYWIHFTVNGRYTQSEKPVLTNPIIDLPTLDYHAHNVLLYLVKKQPVPNQKMITPIIEQLFESCDGDSDDGFWRAQQLFIDLLQTIQTNIKNDDFKQTIANSTRLYLQTHYNEPISVELLATLFHVHPNTIILSMKERFGITPNKFLMRYRLEEASKQLLSSKLSIETISGLVGYENAYYFSRIFKKQFGLSPSNYRLKYVEDLPH